MRELHVAAVSEEGRHVLLTAREGSPGAEFRLALDGRLASALRGELTVPGEPSAPAGSIRPREIQARLRAGESSEQIAASVGVPVVRIERFAGPVISEREGAISRVQAARLARPRRGLSDLPLGEAVAHHLSASPGYKPETVEWTARREATGAWVVRLTYVARARRRVASWRYDPAAREVSALDAASVALGHVDSAPGVRVSARPAVPGSSRLSAAPAGVVGRPAARRTTSSGAPPRQAVPAARARRSSNAPPVVPAATDPAPDAPSAPRAVPAPPRRRAGAAPPTVPVAAPPTTAPPARAGRSRSAKPRVTPTPVMSPPVTSPTAPAAVRAPRAPEVPGDDRAGAPALRRPARVVPAPAASSPSRRAGATPTPAGPVRAASTPAASGPPPASGASVPAAAVRRRSAAPAPGRPPLLRVVPPSSGSASERDRQPDRDREPDRDDAGARTAQRPPVSRRAAGGRATVPAWADVLLGTAPVQPSRHDQPPDD